MSEQSRLTERIRRLATRRDATVRASSGHSAPSSRKRIGSIGGLALVVVLSAQFVVVLDFSIVNVALPSISRELHASSTSVQWVVTAYAITFGGLLVLGGRAADLFGRRRLFVAGLVGVAVASAAGGVGINLPLLVLPPAGQGGAGAPGAPAAVSVPAPNL